MSQDDGPRSIKNVTPPEFQADLAGLAGSSTPPSGAGAGTAEGVPPATPDQGSAWWGTTWRAGNWEGPTWRGAWGYVATPRPSFPWVGVLLLLLGAALLLHQLDPRLDSVAVFSTALGILFLVAWAQRLSRLALWPAVIFLSYGIARLAVGLGVVEGAGWTTLGVGVGLAVGWLVSTMQGGGSRWTLLFAGGFALIGLTQVSAHVAGLEWVGAAFWAIVIMGLGLFVLWSGLRRRA